MRSFLLPFVTFPLLSCSLYHISAPLTWMHIGPWMRPHLALYPGVLCSVSVRKPGFPDTTLSKDPTAQRDVEPFTVTASSLFAPAPCLGLDTMLHFVPLKCSMRVYKPSPLVVTALPTAQTSLLLIAATPKSCLRNASTLGVAIWLHFWPFQWMASV